jgi:phage-related protein
MAKRTVWDLALNISGKGTEASQAIRTVKKQLEDLKGAAGQLGKDWKAFTGNASKLALGAAGGIAAATAGVVSMANSFAQAGDKAAKTSAALGVGVEAYQELTYAMGQSGLSAQEFDSALQKFNLTVRQGAAGNEAMQKQLLAVGLSAQKLAGMKPEQAMERLSDYMKTLPNEAERTRVAVTLFGKTAGPKMMAAMAQGSEGLRQLSQEARDLGIVITDEQAKQSEAYGSALTRLKQSVTGFKNQFIGSAIGPLTEAFDHLKDAVVEQMPAIREIGRNFGLWLGDAVKRLPEIIAKIKEFGSWVKNTVTGVKDFVGGWKNLAKILAGLAVAPTFISGLKTVFSLGQFINTAMKSLPMIMAKMGLAAVPIGSALLPIIGIIAGIAAAVFLIVKNWDKVKPVLISAVSGIRDAIGKIIESITAWWEKHGEGVMAVIGKTADIITGVFTTAWKILSTSVGIAANVIGGFIGLVADCAGWLTEHKTILGLVAIAVGTVTAAIIAYNAAQAVANAGGIVAVARMGAQAIATGALSAVTGVWSTVSGIATVATTAFGAAMAFLTSPITLVVLAIGAVIAAAYLIIKNWDAISEFFKGLWENIKGVFSGIGSWFADKFNAAKEAVKGAFTGIGAWFGEKFNAAKEAIKGAFTGVIDWVKNNWKSIALFIINPFAGVFKYLYDNFEGFRNAVNNVVSAVKGFFERGIDFIKNIINSLPEPFQNIFAAVKTIIDSFVGFWKNVFASAVAAIKNIAGFLPGIFEDPIGTIKAIFGEFVGFWKNVFQGGFDFFNKIIGDLPEPFQKVFAGIRIVIDGFTGFWKNAFNSAVNAVKNIAAFFPNIFTDPMGTIKAVIGEIGGFFRNVFQGAVNAVNGIIDGFADRFGGVFVSIKEKIEGFVNFFTSKFEGIKNFFGGIGNVIGGVFGGRDNAMPGHASGGIFTQPHIAQIAEKGAEAVVPLNKSPQAFDIWKQAGELGGYLKTASGQTPAISAAASVSTAAPPLKTPEPSPITAAAAQRISSGSTAVNVEFKMTNNFNGGTPDGGAVKQIYEAGRKAGDDFESRVRSVFESMMRDRTRVSYG